LRCIQRYSSNWIKLDPVFLGRGETQKEILTYQVEHSLLSKRLGRFGVIDLDLQNKCLLSKWLFKLINEDGLSQTILRNKYMRGKSFTQVEYMPGDSHFWAGLMKVKHVFLGLERFKLGGCDPN
jgi:hypothetical protein